MSSLAKDMSGWDPLDPDLRCLTGNEPVTLGEVPTRDFANIDDELGDYTALIQSGCLPPVWFDGICDCLFTGEHRLTAAHRLGMETYPAYIITEIVD